jgi:hypothetical protein
MNRTLYRRLGGAADAELRAADESCIAIGAPIVATTPRLGRIELTTIGPPVSLQKVAAGMEEDPGAQRRACR